MGGPLYEGSIIIVVSLSPQQSRPAVSPFFLAVSISGPDVTSWQVHKRVLERDYFLISIGGVIIIVL